MLYGVTDVPPWYMCILLGFQHYLTMFGSTVAVPLILAGPLGIANNNVAKGQIISTIFFASGISTLLQTLIGNRLPIVQGAAFSFLTPAIAIMNSVSDPLPSNIDAFLPVRRPVQGAIMVASCTQVFLGLTGLVGLLMSRIGPLTIAPTITLVGLGLFGPAGDFAGKHWGISFLTMFLIILFSQHLRDVVVPLPRFKKHGGKRFVRVKVILAVLIAWMFCGFLTAAGAFPASSQQYGYFARTDVRSGVLADAAWFRFPYPGQWGVPVVTASGVLGMISGVLASIIESIGDYYACARLSQVPPPPTHAINRLHNQLVSRHQPTKDYPNPTKHFRRGVFTEGIGCILAGALGTGNGTTSYSENIGAIGITKVGSRRVVQTGAVIMLILAVIGKFGALFTTIPDPVVGGMFCVMFGMIAAVGMSSLQFVDLNSSRNLLVMGFSIFMGVALPEWVRKNKTVIATGSVEGDQIVLVLLQTGMFIAGVLGFVLDNTIPGK
uniref:Solute carrier family 23 member 2 n=1 Tax=Ciona savignyi TaxID=51511 RepID=H2YFV9_CIOSA